MERLFIGWDVPALGAAAALLVDQYAGEAEARLDTAVVVLPGARAGRRLAELLLEEAGRRGLRLAPPRITTIGALPELLYEPDAVLADSALTRRVWAHALRSLERDGVRRVFPYPPEPDDLPGWTTLARIVERLHREVGGAGLRFHDVVARCREGLLHDDGERWAMLARAQDAYADRLRALGYADRELSRIAALEAGATATGREIWLVGIVELPGVVRGLLAAHAAHAAPVRAIIHAPADRAAEFDDEGCVRPDAWLDAVVPIPDDRLRLRDRPPDQAAEALDAIAALDGRFAAEEIAIGVPDDEIVPYLEQRLAAVGLPLRYGAGVPLARTGPYRLLAAVAAYLDGRRFDALAALLRHPDLWRWLGRQGDEPDGGPPPEIDAHLAAADGYFRESLPAHVAAGLAGENHHRPALAAVLRALESDALLGGLRGRRRLADWAPAILRLLVEVYGGAPLDPAAPADRRIVEACDRLHAVAAGLYGLPEEIDEPCDAVQAIRLLLAEVEGAAVPPDATHAAIELLGWLELHLDDAPALILTGMNEPRLPESVSADAFLPNALRSRLGLADNDLRYARDAYLLTAILHSRPEVRLIAGRRSAAGDPLRPSRLIFAAPERTVAERVLRFYGDEAAATAATAAAAPSRTSRFRLPPEPELAAPAPISRLRVTDFGALLRDPYRFALERILGLESLDDAARELDGAVFGSLGHEVLHHFGQAAEAAATDATAIAHRLDALLDAAAGRRFGRHPLPAVLVQVEQLRARLHTFAGWQADWIGSGWRIAAVEASPPGDGVPFHVDGEPILLRGRIDRIDHHPEAGAWAVFDYKTSDRGDPPERTHRAGSKDDKRWIDLQLPLYRVLLAALRGPDGSPLVPPRALDDVRLGYILLPRDLGAVGAAIADWTAEDLTTADEAAREAVRTLRANHFVFDPDRATTFRGDPLAPLLGIGQLTATDDDEEGGPA